MSSVPHFVVRGDSARVQAWSTRRLPFEPVGPMLELRGELRAALRAMAPIVGRAFHAVYTAAEDGEFADVENVLLYNVGASATRHLVSSGVRFERAFALPPPAPSGQLFAHNHDYQLGGVATGFQRWQMGDLLASFAGVCLVRADKPEHVWAAIHGHRPRRQPSTGRTLPASLFDSSCDPASVGQPARSAVWSNRSWTE